MTFTTVEASEMRQLVVGGKSILKELTVPTFHAFCPLALLGLWRQVSESSVGENHLLGGL